MNFYEPQIPRQKNKKNKSKGNAYFQFMLELRDKPAHRNKSMAEMAIVANPLWQKMSSEERKPYEQLAKLAKNNINMSKCTASGRDLLEAELEEKREQDEEAQMRDDISNEIMLLKESSDLEQELFFVMHINMFCYCDRQKAWYPAEIAVAAFNLLDGVLSDNIFHRMVKPGPLPIGYAAEVKLASEKTHQIPVPLDDEDNLSEVFKGMTRFLEQRSGRKGQAIRIYVIEEFLKRSKELIANLCEEFGYPSHRLKVYSLDHFFTILRNTCARDNEWHSDTFSSRQLELDYYSHCLEIACEFHQMSQKQTFCSKAIVTRYVYTICDNCCHLIQIMMIKGQHVPSDAKFSAVPSRRGTSASSVHSSNRNLSEASSTLDDDSSTVRSFGQSEWDTQSNVSSIVLDEFPLLGSRSKKKDDAWNRYKPVDAAAQSYARAMGKVDFSAQNSAASVISGVSELTIGESDSSFPSLGRGRGLAAKRRGFGRGRGNAYERVRNVE